MERNVLVLQTRQLEWFWWMAGWMMIIPLVWFALAIIIAVYVYRDAEKRGMGGALWLVIILVTGIIGLIVYLVVRKPETPAPPYGPPPGVPPPPPTNACPTCGMPLRYIEQYRRWYCDNERKYV